MKFLYNTVLHLLALLALPLLAKQKYRKKIAKRLGKDFPQIEKEGKALIWIHAVSLGETKAIAPLLKKLKALPSKPKILLTTVTETGLKEGKDLGADYNGYLPLDFSYIIGRVVKAVQPDLLILTETDFWFNFQHSVKNSGGKVVVVNAKLSSRSFQRLLKLPRFAKKLFSTIDLFLVQGPLYEKRFSLLGVPQEKIVSTGNIKLDGFTVESDIESWKKQLHINPDDLILTIGSTHDPEEKIFIKIFATLFQKYPQLKVLLVPRHPERFDQVETLLKEGNISYGRLSQGNLQDKKVILIDAMGKLRKCYQISDLAFVGGSFTEKVGGHNILEPPSYGVPVLFGPYMHSQPDFLDLANAYQAGECVAEKSLLATLEKYLNDPILRKEVGARGLKLISESRGALEQTYKTITSLL